MALLLLFFMLFNLALSEFLNSSQHRGVSKRDPGRDPKDYDGITETNKCVIIPERLNKTVRRGRGMLDLETWNRSRRPQRILELRGH